MDVIGVIPARYGATRFEGKVLADILGRPMIQHVWEQAKKARLLNDLVIAADDERIINAAKKFSAKTVLTAKGHTSGTDRLTEVVNQLDVKIVVNIQADEPLINPTIIDRLAGVLLDDPNIYIASVIKKIKSKDQIKDPNVVKVVVDRQGFALYFSRAAIPHCQDDKKSGAVYYKHLGLYAYTKDFLFTYTNLPQSALEKSEHLEQLRALENGYRIKVIETEYDSIGVDTKEDLELVKKILLKKND
ncbi:MAG: 3-deoxy-manno-octulosonate cytidylyltransferase [Candidatus Omnitrophota bacterium]